MVDAFTSTDPATLGTSLVQTAYDTLVEWDLRSEVQFRALADKSPGHVPMRGATIVMQLAGYLAAATSPLDEVTDVSAVAAPSTRSVSVTLREYGNAMVTSAKLRQVALADVEPIVAHEIAINLRDSLDGIVEPVLRGGTNYIRLNNAVVKSNLIGADGTTVATKTTDTFRSSLPRMAVTKFRAQSVEPKQGSDYTVFLHPDQSHDLRSETGAGGWRQPQEYFAGTGIWSGLIGGYEGAHYIETPRIYNALDGESGTTRVYRSFALGRQALAEASAIEPHLVLSPVTDHLVRFRGVGWYGLLGWARYREEALIRIETSSSVASA